MIPQMRTLLRVKDLKLDQALRAMQAKRAQLAEAVAETERALACVEDSIATYMAREDAIYAGIIGSVVDNNGIDETRGRVVQLEKDHRLLTDALERSRHVQARVEKELETAVAAYGLALRARDKFSLITDDMQRAHDIAVEQREENEVEELFSKPGRKVA